MRDNFTIMEISRMIDVSRSTVLNWIKEGRLNSFQLPGGNNRVKKGDLITFMDEYQLPIDLLDKSTKKRILIVDDNESILEILSEAFKREEQFAVRTASSGFSTGIIIHEFKPHIVILDIGLGDIDGREVCRTLKGNPELRQTQVIGISGIVSQNEIDTMLADGFSDFFSKPLQLPELIARTRKLLNIT